MTDSNGVKPSNEELQEIIELAGLHGKFGPKALVAISELASAELQRRQQPDVSAIHTGKMTPRDEDLHEIMRLAGRKICDLSIIQIGRLNTLSAMYFGYLAKAEYERRQQPAGEAASVPAELVARWHAEACLAWPEHVARPWGFTKFTTEYLANKAAAYGRGQSQQNELMRSLARSLTHVMHCRTCGEMSCEDCGGGQDAIDALENYSNYLLAAAIGKTMREEA